jgi:DNA repair protein RecO (recombination protein O)
MHAIVLSQQPIREYDALVTLYTKEHGKYVVIAKGLKKSTSKHASVLQPCAFVDAQIVRGKEIDYLTTVYVEEYFSHIRTNIVYASIAQAMAKGYSQLFEPKERDTRAFDHLYHSLDQVSRVTSAITIFLDIFFLRTIALLGFPPNLTACGNCEKDLQHEETSFFLFETGEGVCVSCMPDSSIHKKTGIWLSSRSREYLVQALELRVFEEESLHPSDTTCREEVHEAVYGYSTFHTGRRVFDWANIEKLLCRA